MVSMYTTYSMQANLFILITSLVALLQTSSIQASDGAGAGVKEITVATDTLTLTTQDKGEFLKLLPLTEEHDKEGIRHTSPPHKQASATMVAIPEHKHSCSAAGTGLPPRHPSTPTLRRSSASTNLALYHGIPMIEPEAATYNQVLDLYNIFIFLYTYAIHITLDNSEFFIDKDPDSIIVKNLNTLSGLLSNGDVAINTPRFIGIAYEAIQIFNLVGFLPLERDIATPLPSVIGPALEAAFTNSHNIHRYITIAEEWVLKFAESQYFNSEPDVSDVLAKTYYTRQVLAIALNLCHKFLNQLRRNINFFPEFITDRGEIIAYEAFIKTQAGCRSVTTIEKYGIRYALEKHHASYAMKATRKAILLYNKASNSRSYPFLDAENVHTMALTIGEGIRNKGITQDQLYESIGMLIKRQFPAHSAEHA